ncbi:hypothetical protein FDI40_gp063 [Agrobacterium phage Atu_ph07]|uniref:Uncharacterized protein n=1 Tax=Agrobacterium phage Atu_ph07 TaxID=2024264 RepID=A0A2L0UZA6_9CAUD|nr:hypothetical protein FDI40_gp063 [Agrobacterium phage Atu_ph07]AUZ94875.1 hypothetical protein [Agrobacterium phage Atu_ph07]
MRLFQLLETAEETYIEAKARDLGLSISVTERNDKIIIHMLKAITPGEGTGSILMKYICAYADQNNKIVLLTPEKIQGTTSVSRLIDFYKRFGFVVNKGKDKDFSISYGMYRLPKGSITETAELNDNNVAEFIRKKCQPYLRMNPDFNNNPLYRGISSSEPIIVSAIRTDRKPLDTDLETHNKIVKELSNRGIKANRDNSIFCSGDSDVPYTYGNTYVIFPIGEFDFTWNPKILDMTTNIAGASTVIKDDERIIVIGSDYYKQLSLRLKRDVKHENYRVSTNDILKAYGSSEDVPEEIFVEMVRKHKVKYNPELDKTLDTYKTTDLVSAIKSGCEIMISGKEYIAIKYSNYTRFQNIAKEIKR